MSSEPLEEEGFGWEEERTPMPWLAPLGAIIGAAVGYALSAFTQRTYPLPTGGMPIVAMWPTGIIMYELMMLGAILATIVAFVVARGCPTTESAYMTRKSQTERFSWGSQSWKPIAAQNLSNCFIKMARSKSNSSPKANLRRMPYKRRKGNQSLPLQGWITLPRSITLSG